LKGGCHEVDLLIVEIDHQAPPEMAKPGFKYISDLMLLL
jgi:hypothetical protein